MCADYVCLKISLDSANFYTSDLAMIERERSHTMLRTSAFISIFLRKKIIKMIKNLILYRNKNQEFPVLNVENFRKIFKEKERERE